MKPLVRKLAAWLLRTTAEDDEPISISHHACKQYCARCNHEPDPTEPMLQGAHSVLFQAWRTRERVYSGTDEDTGRAQHIYRLTDPVSGFSIWALVKETAAAPVMVSTADRPLWSRFRDFAR